MESNKSVSKTKTECKNDLRNDQDQYCWLCHKDKVNLSCQICPRSYHLKCINSNPTYSQLDSFTLLNDKKTFIKDNWVCFECELISKSESDEGKSECLKRITKDEFCELLCHAVATIKKSTDVTFHTPVNLEVYNDYTDFIVHPMDFYKIEQYVKTKKYSSTEAFLSDCKWILHNCYIFNQATNPLTLNARYMLKVAKNEMYELETCPDCFRNVYKFTYKDFFIQPCSHPHNLVLAKLKGHPLWPSKVVKFNTQTKEAEVRFFGAHDKAWISLDNCFLLNEIPSTSKVNKNQRGKLEIAIKELEAHLNLLNEKFPNLFQFSPPKTALKPDQVYLIPLPEHLTTSQQPSVSYSSSSIKDTSSINENLNSDNAENVITQPPKKQKKTAPVAASVKSNQQQPTKPNKQMTNETDLNDSDDDNEHKLVIDDDSLINSTNKRRPLSKRSDSTSSSTKSSTTAIKANSSVQKRKLSAVEQSNVQKNESSSLLLKDDSTSSISSKKKLKKNLNDSISSNSSSNYIVTNYQSQQTSTISKEKVDQLVEQVQYLKGELERSRNLHIQEIKEMFENHKSEFRDLKLSLDAEKAKALASLRRELESKHNKSIEEIKRKSWCTNCLKVASYFCCRLASYCSYDCQSEHWINHMTTCLQNKESTTAAITTTESDQKFSSPVQQDTDIEKESIDETNSQSEDDKQKELLTIEKVAQKAIEKSPVKKIKQIIEEKNEQQNKSNEQVNKTEESKSKEQPISIEQNKNKVSSIKSTDESNKSDDLKLTSIEIKKPIIEKQIIEQPPLSKSKHPEKPKDRFLKKLNENKSILIESTSKPSVKNEEEVKSNLTIVSDNPKKSEFSSDKPTELISDKKIIDKSSSKETDKMQIDEKNQQESKIEKNKRPDELELMRQNLMKKFLESKKQQMKIENLKDKSNEDKKLKSIDCSKEVSNKEQKNKSTDKPIEEISVKDKDEKKDSIKDLKQDTSIKLDKKELDVNLSEESDEEESKIEAKIEAKSVSKDEFKVKLNFESKDESKNKLKDEFKDKSKDSSKDKSKDVQLKVTKDELKNDDDEDFDDDSNLMVELINKGLKRTEEEKLNAKEATKDQLVNQQQNNEEISTSLDDDQSTIHFDVNQVKEDLISKVENELNN